MSDLEHWVEAWELNHIGWHRDTVNKNLIDNLETLTNGKPNLKILVPFCGKTLDMIFLIEQGHRVIGVEAVTQAIEDLFKENEIPFTKEALNEIPNGGSVYIAFDGKLKIFECDYFNFKSSVAGGKVDGIWDCNALGAVYPDKRKEYIQRSLELLQPHGRILNEAFVYDTKERPKEQGHPYSVSLEELGILFELFMSAFVGIKAANKLNNPPYIHCYLLQKATRLNYEFYVNTYTQLNGFSNLKAY